MTTNQINYFKAKLDEAHYERSDAENARHNYAVEQISREQNEETRRANLAREQETHRSNVANETNYYANLQETMRHNLATEQLTGENIGIQKERATYQNLLDMSNIGVNQERKENLIAETTLLGYKTTAQDIQNKKSSLDYNLDVTYSEGERATRPISDLKVMGVPIGSAAQLLVNTVSMFRSSGKQPTASYNTSTTKKPYFQLNSR